MRFRSDRGWDRGGMRSIRKVHAAIHSHFMSEERRTVGMYGADVVSNCRQQ